MRPTDKATADSRSVQSFAIIKNTGHGNFVIGRFANKLPLNEDKTKALTITGKRCVANINGSDIDVFVNGKQLSNVDCATLSGVEIDSKLSFNEHIEKVCKKLASRIAILRKIRACLPLKQRLQFYNSIIRPVMSFANVVWANCDKESVYRVLRLQKRAARVISYADRMTPSVALFNKLGWIPFYEQHKIDKCIIMYKRINGYLPNYLNEHLI